MEGVSEPVNWQPYLEAKKATARAAMPERGIDILAGDVRSPLWARIFSRRERWFDRHRKCEVRKEPVRGWDGSHMDRFECASWTCKRSRSAWYDVFPF